MSFFEVFEIVVGIFTIIGAIAGLLSAGFIIKISYSVKFSVNNNKQNQRINQKNNGIKNKNSIEMNK